MASFRDLISMDLIEAAIGELEEETRIKRQSMVQSKIQEKRHLRKKSWESSTTNNSLPSLEETKLEDEFWVVRTCVSCCRLYISLTADADLGWTR